jgi:hypothetical protein
MPRMSLRPIAATVSDVTPAAYDVHYFVAVQQKTY